MFSYSTLAVLQVFISPMTFAYILEWLQWCLTVWDIFHSHYRSSYQQHYTQLTSMYAIVVTWDTHNLPGMYTWSPQACCPQVSVTSSLIIICCHFLLCYGAVLLNFTYHAQLQEFCSVYYAVYIQVCMNSLLYAADNLFY